MTSGKLVVSVVVIMAFATNAVLSFKIRLPEIPYETLKTHLESAENKQDELVERLKDVGGKVGVFAITELPESYETALRALTVEAQRCLVRTGDPDLPLTVPMPDGSTRTTYATESANFPSCLNMADLVEVFDRVESMVATLIEKVHEKQLSYVTADSHDAGKARGSKQLSYVTADLREVGLMDFPDKDHVHVYEKAAASSSSDMMVPYHTDNGIFLIITPFPDHGMDVVFSDGSTGSTEDVDSRSVLVLMGRGMTEWLFQEGGYPDAQRINQLFHPVPHAVKSMNGIPIRSVYARMKVALGSALPASLTQKVGTNRVKPLKSFREVFMERGGSSEEGLCTVNLSSSPVTYSPVNHDWFRAMDALCHHGMAYCWMSCMKLPESCPNPDLAKCFNNKSHLSCRTDLEGEVMDPGCRWHCNNDDGGTVANSSNDFCNGATDMHMMGFEAAGGDRRNLCVILFISAWTLDSRLKFGVACFGVLLLGMSIEGLVFLRRRFNRHLRREIVSPYLPAPKLLRRAASMLMFGLNVFLGYLAMLVAMTYSIELFCCVLLGLVIGHAVFNIKAAVGESVDPCCAPSHQNLDEGGTANLLFDSSSPAGLLPCTRTPIEGAGAASVSILRSPSGSNPSSPSTSPKCHRSGEFQ